MKKELKKKTKKHQNKHAYNSVSRGYLLQILRLTKKLYKLTIEKTAELLCISPRSCSDILNGKQGVSAATVMCLLASIPEEYALNIIRQFRKNILHREEMKIPM